LDCKKDTRGKQCQPTRCTYGGTKSTPEQKKKSPKSTMKQARPDEKGEKGPRKEGTGFSGAEDVNHAGKERWGYILKGQHPQGPRKKKNGLCPANVRKNPKKEQKQKTYGVYLRIGGGTRRMRSHPLIGQSNKFKKVGENYFFTLEKICLKRENRGEKRGGGGSSKEGGKVGS